MFGDKIGPTETVIPEQRFYSCLGCKYFDHFMVKSGQHPVYDTVCKRMDYQGNVLEEGELCLNHYPLSLSHRNETPSCCPYLKSTMRDDKLNKIL